jgi:hypothetical protein
MRIKGVPLIMTQTRCPLRLHNRMRKYSISLWTGEHQTKRKPAHEYFPQFPSPILLVSSEPVEQCPFTVSASAVSWSYCSLHGETRLAFPLLA